MATHNIKTKTARAQLPYQKNPYWCVISNGLAVGYSVPVSHGEGSWHLRVGVSGRYVAEKVPPEIFVSVPSKDTKFDQACEYARAHHERLSSGYGLPRKDVSALASAYLSEKKRLHATQPDKTRRIESFIRCHIDRKPLGGVSASQLNRIDIETWLAGHVASDLRAGTDKHTSACASANRGLAQLKAILNWAHSNKLLIADDAWAQIKKYSGVSRSRSYIPTLAEFEAVYSQSAGVLKDLMLFLAETGMRPGEPLKLQVQDIDPSSRIVRIPEDTKTGRRTIKVSVKAMDLLQSCSKGKCQESYIFGEGSKPIDSCQMSKWFRKARERAGVDDEFVLYSLRHAWITNAIKQRSPMEVAKYAGTSMQMIESFYLKFDSENFIDNISPMFSGAVS